MAEYALAFNDFSYTYEDGTAALRNITFTVGHGESVGLIGHNGSGKSTLLMNIVGIMDPDNRVVVDGMPVTKSSLREIRQRVGYVFQDSHDQLFMSSVREDVTFGPLNAGLSPEEALGKAATALEAVGLAGFDDRISYHLSGGEMRRVAIATVLAMSSDIIVMDEPSSGLDPRAKRELAALIRSLNGTKFISSHDLDFIRLCTDRVILLNKGKIAAEGATNDILEDRELLERNGL